MPKSSKTVNEAAVEWVPGEVTVFEVTADEVLQGFKAVDCPDCYGSGLIPWLPWEAIEECIRCKGTGVDYIGV